MTRALTYLEMLQLGQEAGLRYFMSQFGESLRFFAYKITKDREASEEIVSESFYKLWERKEKIPSLEFVRSFLFLITRNSCYDYVGSSYQRKVSLEEEAVLDINQESTDILTHIIYVELIEQITTELKKLPKQQAEVFRLSYLEGMSTREICETLETTASNVYFARSKAISALRLIFKENDISLYTGFLFFLFFK